MAATELAAHVKRAPPPKRPKTADQLATLPMALLTRIECCLTHPNMIETLPCVAIGRDRSGHHGGCLCAILPGPCTRSGGEGGYSERRARPRRVTPARRVAGSD